MINEKLPTYLSELRASGILVGLDTGYPPDIQELLMKKLGFAAGKGGNIDGYISAYQVRAGRPYPYMIHQARALRIARRETNAGVTKQQEQLTLLEVRAQSAVDGAARRGGRAQGGQGG